MKSITEDGIVEKNALSNSGTWILLIDMDLSELGGSVYYWTSNNVNVTWPVGGQLYSARPIRLGEVEESLSSKIPRITLQIADIDRFYVPLLLTYNGWHKASVRLRLVHSDHLDSTTPEIDETYSVVESTMDAQWIELTLGSVDPLSRRFPRDAYVATMCRHVYKGGICRYDGAEPAGETTCDHTITACEARSNEAQYGGSPGVTEGLYG